MAILEEHKVVETVPEPVIPEPVIRPVVVQGYAHVPVAERLAQAVFVLAGIVLAMIGVRFLLLALGADMATSFGSFMLTLTEPLVGPFVGLFGPSPATGVSILELSSLFAMFIYTLATLAVVSLVRLLIAPQAPVAITQ